MKPYYWKYLLLPAFMIFFQQGLVAQILGDSASISILRKGVHNIYNCEFSQAREVVGKLEPVYPGHPVIPLMKGLILYWENFPLTPSSPALEPFKNEMLTCIRLCEGKRLLPGEAEYLLADIGARGLLLTFYADNGLGRSVIPMAAKTYQDVVKAFDYTGTFADFSFVTGLYNYYRETYPDVHPFYKPFALLFPRGNRKEGLRQLEHAASNSIFLIAEALSFLTWINTGYERNYAAAHRYSKKLLKTYPRNNVYLAMQVKSLLLLHRYDEAEMLLSTARQPESHWFNAEKTVLQAILQEKKYENHEAAEMLYRNALQKTSAFGEYANEYNSFCYFGLSRIASEKGDPGVSREFHKKAANLATYKHLDFGD